MESAYQWRSKTVLEMQSYNFGNWKDETVLRGSGLEEVAAVDFIDTLVNVSHVHLEKTYPAVEVTCSELGLVSNGVFLVVGKLAVEMSGHKISIRR
jgi:hypothetical protein